MQVGDPNSPATKTRTISLMLLVFICVFLYNFIILYISCLLRIIFLDSFIQEEGWVVCRVFKKRIATVRRMNEHESPCWYEEPMSFMPDLDSPNQSSHSNFPHHVSSFPCKKEVEYLPYQQAQVPQDNHNFLHLPLLESQKLANTFALDVNLQTPNFQPSAPKQQNIPQQHSDQNLLFLFDNNNNSSDEQTMDELTDWRVFDKYVASQLSQENVNNNNASKQEVMVPQNAPTSTTSTSPIDQLWK